MLARSFASTSSAAWRSAASTSSSSTSAIASTSASAIRLLQSRPFSTSSVVREEQATPTPAPSSTRSNLSSLPGSSSSLGSPTTRTTPTVRGNRIATEPHRLHVQSTRNNTLLTLTDSAGNKLLTRSGGSVGFKKAARSGYEAGYRAAVEMFRAVEDNAVRWRMSGIDMIWNGFGQGREAVFRALMASEGQGVQPLVTNMTDATRIKIGGVRPKKRRML